MDGPSSAEDAMSLDAEGLPERRHADETLTGDVLLDSGVFARCAFVGARLRYAGGPPPVMQDCTFDNISFAFEGAAGRTLALLKAMSKPRSGLSEVFKASFPHRYGH